MVKVTILGAAGGIGQPLSLLVKNESAVTELALFDVVPVVKGVAADISHVDTPAVVEGYTKDDEGLAKALEGADIVVIPAGVPRKPGMTRDDLFSINAGIVRDLATAIAKSAPKAFVAIISNPVNSTVPIAVEVLKKEGVFDPKRVFGVTTLDVVRASTMSAQAINEPTSAPKYTIPVVGGHSGITILPLLSQASPALPAALFSDADKYKELIKRIQFGGDEVVAAKAGAGSATLSMAYAGYKFVKALIAGAFEKKAGVIEPSFVYLDGGLPGSDELKKELGQEISYFSARIQLGANGVEAILPLGKLNDTESELLKAAIPELDGSIKKGESFISKL